MYLDLNTWPFTIAILFIYSAIIIMVIDVIVTEWIPRTVRAYHTVRKWMTAIKYQLQLFRYLMKRNAYFVPWWTSGSLVETSFAQFKIFYEIYKDDIYPAKDVMKKYWKGEEWDNFDAKQRAAHVKYLTYLENSYELMNDIYKYITVTRDANRALIDAIQAEMMEDIKINIKNNDDPSIIFAGIKHFEIKYSFSEFGHLIINKKTQTKKAKTDWLEVEMACEEMDAVVAKKIIDIRELLCN